MRRILMLGVVALILATTGCSGSDWFTASPAEKAVMAAARTQGLDPIDGPGYVEFDTGSTTRGTVTVDLLVGSDEKYYELSFEILPNGWYVFGCPKSDGTIVPFSTPFVRDSLNHDWRCPAIFP